MKKIGFVFVMLFIVSALFLSGCTQPSDSNDNTISSTGVGEVNILPDEVTVHMSIETLADTAEESEQENARISERVRNELYSMGIAASDVQTSNFNIYPEYDWSQGGREQIGYKTTNSLMVKTSQFSKIGRIIDAGVQGGANRIDSVQFGLSEEKQAEAKKVALEDASKDAREKAEAIVSGLGVKLGKIKSVSSQDYFYTPRVAYAGGELEDAVSAAETIVVPNELETSARVQVVFEIA